MTPEQDREQAQRPDETPPRVRRDTRYGLVIARPFGVPVYISPYWFVMAGLFVLLLREQPAESVHPAACATWWPRRSSSCCTPLCSCTS